MSTTRTCAPYELAALHTVALVEAHAFQDANKRTVLLAIRAFLRANDVSFVRHL